MGEASCVLADLHDQRLAVHATSAAPVWLWSTDATRILWANPVGAAIFNASTPAALAMRRLDAGEQSARQIARVAATLFPGGTPRLERLRGFGAGLGRTLLCTCSRLALDTTAGILVVALEPVGRPMPLAERIRRLYADSGHEIAAFTPDGALLFATAGALQRLEGATTLQAFGGDAFAAAALDAGHASGETSCGGVSIRRIGSESTIVLVVTFAPSPSAEPSLGHPGSAEATLTPAVSEPEPAPDGAMETIVEPPQDTTPPAPAAPTDLRRPDPDANILSPPNAPEPHRPPSPLTIDMPLSERRYPLRFVWQMDAEGRFTLGSEEFIDVIGPKTAVALGRPWKDIAAELALDPEGQVLRAVATRDTWSGIAVSWPVDGGDDRLKVELSGLPAFDRNRVFLGYRGFGVCRDIDRIAALCRQRRPVMFTSADTTAPAQSESPASGGSPPPSSDAVSPKLEEEASAAAVSAADGPDLSVVQSAQNVVPFRTPMDSKAPADSRAPSLSPLEHNAFRELARQLSARLNGEEDGKGLDEVVPDAIVAGAPPSGSEDAQIPTARDDAAGAVDRIARGAPADEAQPEHIPLLERLPVGLLVYRFDQLLYANPAFLQATGYPTLDALAQAGGLGGLFIAGGEGPDEIASPEKSLTIATQRGDKLPVAGRLFPIPWYGESALVLMLVGPAYDDRPKTVETALQRAEAGNRELRSILDIATDGVIVLDRDGRIASGNRTAEALFGYATNELAHCSLADLFAPESKSAALDYFDRISRSGVASLLNDGCEVMGRVRPGGLIPLFMTMGPIADGMEKFCAIFRDLTPWKKAEQDLVAVKRQVEKAAAAKSEFLGKISHEIRTPLNSIIGFSEMMLEERFGPIGNERYREYLKDICCSGTHVIAFLNDLLDLSKVETGNLELTFASVNLNEVVQSCVTAMQPQANRERIIIRTSLSPSLRPITADARSVRQIILNLLGNAIELTAAGGQVIVSTGQTDQGTVVLRVRDTGIGINAKDMEAALQPFQQPATTSQSAAAGTGLGLPLTKALAEANRGIFTITSKVDEGTLIEIAFPANCVLAE